jgi:hypothetical protein
MPQGDRVTEFLRQQLSLTIARPAPPRRGQVGSRHCSPIGGITNELTEFRQPRRERPNIIAKDAPVRALGIMPDCDLLPAVATHDAELGLPLRRRRQRSIARPHLEEDHHLLSGRERGALRSRAPSRQYRRPVA